MTAYSNLRRVRLIFPDQERIADFISKEKVKRTEVNCFEHTVITTIEIPQIAIARREYQAVLNAIISKERN